MDILDVVRRRTEDQLIGKSDRTAAGRDIRVVQIVIPGIEEGGEIGIAFLGLIIFPYERVREQRTQDVPVCPQASLQVELGPFDVRQVKFPSPVGHVQGKVVESQIEFVPVDEFVACSEIDCQSIRHAV